MKVLWIFRKRKANAFSIERVFLSIKEEMQKLVEVEIFEADSRRYLIKDIIKLWKKENDIFHITGDISYYTLLLPKRKIILTIHDIGHYTNTLKGIKKKIYGYFWILLPIKRATLVTCVSKKTYNDIFEHFPSLANSNKLSTIENSFPREFIYKEKTFTKNKPRILQVGTSSYKNIETVIKAISEIPCIFVLIGRLTNAQKELLREMNIEYENYANIESTRLLEEYQKADMVTFISIGEGFGLPILEAQATGRVLITSDVSPLKDIAGDGAALVNPNNIEEIRSAIKKLIYDDKKRMDLIEYGLKNVQQYTPVIAAQKYFNIYKELYND